MGILIYVNYLETAICKVLKEMKNYIVQLQIILSYTGQENSIDILE